MSTMPKLRLTLVVATAAFACAAGWRAAGGGEMRGMTPYAAGHSQPVPVRVNPADRPAQVPAAAISDRVAPGAKVAERAIDVAPAPDAQTPAIPGTTTPANAVGADGLAARLARAAASATDPAAIATLAAAFRHDAQVVAALRPVLEAWLGSEDPVRQARGVLFLSALDGPAGIGRWREAIDAGTSAEARAVLLSHPPLVGTEEQNAPVVDLLVRAIGCDPLEPVRRAALEGLPAELTREQRERLAWTVLHEPAKELRRRMTSVLARGPVPSPAVLEVLLQIGFDENGDEIARGTALRGLLRAERSNPGTLATDVSRRVRAAADGLEREQRF